MKNRLKKILLSLTIISVMLLVVIAVFDNKYYIGKKIDSFNNVSVYYNGNPKNVNGRNLTKDGLDMQIKSTV